MTILASLRLEPATAAEISPPETPSITVEAMREREALSHRIDHFVSHVITVPADGALSRWREPICPMVGGFTQDIGEYMLTKLSTFARMTNVPLAGEKCKPNFAVILAVHPDQLIEAWSKRQRGLFGDADGVSVKRFKHAETAVRVWYNFALVATDSSSDGSSAMAGLNASGSQIGGTQALQGVPNYAVGSLSRLTHNTANDMQSVIVLIDSGQAQGITYGQLSSYIAMVGFARIKANFDTGPAPSILNLFLPGASPPPGLSAWDESLLKALYSTDQRSVGQVNRIKITLLTDLWH